MLENHKTAFSKLLTKINAIDISASSSSSDSLETEFSDIEDQYRKLRWATFTKREEMKITSDILNQRYDSNHIEKPNNSLKQATDKIITEIDPFEMQEKMIPFNLKKGNWLLRQGRIDEALDAWEEVLKVNPDNEYIHSKLLEARSGSEATRVRAEELHRKYQFEYIGSFGNNVLRKPLAIITDDYEGTVFVSDHENNKICKFNSDGEFLGSLPFTLNRPKGMFKDDKGYIWVCDFLNSRILSIDKNEHIDQFMEITTGCNGRQPIPLYPAYGCFSNGRIYLIVMSTNGQKRRIVFFDLQNPSEIIHINELDTIKRPHSIKIQDNLLYITDMAQGFLFTYDMETKKISRIFKTGPFLYTPRCFAILNNHIFLRSAQYVFKISISGQIIFKVDLSDILDRKSFTLSDFSLIKRNNRYQLFISDISSQACIHTFYV